MATAKFEERIEVVYTLIGESTPRRARLVDLDKKTRADVDKLTILPIYNKSGKLSNAQTLSKIEEFLTGFSALTAIAYPGQFQDINGNKLRTDARCPNLRVVCHYAHDDISSQGFKGTLNGVEVTSPDGELGAFAKVIGDTVKDGEPSHSILREYKFTPKRALSRASVAKRTPIHPIVTSESVESHTQTILVAINALNVTIPDESQKFVADEEVVRNLLTIIREMGVEEEILNNNVEHLISQVNGLKGAETSTVADNCGEYFEQFFNKVIEEAKKSQKQKLINAAVTCVKDGTPLSFNDIAVKYLAHEEVFTEDALNAKIEKLISNKKNSLIQERETQLLDELRSELGDDAFANLSEEDKKKAIKEKLEQFKSEELSSKISDSQIRNDAIVELNREAIEVTLKSLRSAMDSSLVDEEKNRADRWINALGSENLYSLVESLNAKKVSQEEFEETLRPLIANDSVRSLFISAIMAKCNGVATNDMLEEIKYIITGISKNASEEEIVSEIDGSMITLGEMETILNESSEFRQFRDSISTLTNEDDIKYARGVERTLSLEILAHAKQQLREKKDDNFTKEDLLQAFELLVQDPAFAGIVASAAEDCKIAVVTDVSEEQVFETEHFYDDIESEEIEDLYFERDGKQIAYSDIFVEEALKILSEEHDIKTLIDGEELVVRQQGYSALYSADGKYDEIKREFEQNGVDAGVQKLREFCQQSDKFKEIITRIAEGDFNTTNETPSSDVVKPVEAVVEKPQPPKHILPNEVKAICAEIEEYRDLQKASKEAYTDESWDVTTILDIKNDVNACHQAVFTARAKELSEAKSVEEEIQIVRAYVHSDDFKNHIAGIMSKLQREEGSAFVETGVPSETSGTGTKVIFSVIDLILNDSKDYRALLDAYRGMESGKAKTAAWRDISMCNIEVLRACIGKLNSAKDIDEEAQIIREYIESDDGLKKYIADIAKKHGLTLQAKEDTILVTEDDISYLLAGNEHYTDVLQKIMMQTNQDKKNQAQEEFDKIPAWILEQCKDKLLIRDTFEEQFSIIKEFIQNSELFKSKLNDITKVLDSKTTERFVLIKSELLKTPEYSAITEYINSMLIGKTKKDIVLDFCKIPEWVLSECKKKLGLTSEDPTSEQIAKFLTEKEYKDYINQFAKDHEIELSIEEPKHEEAPIWIKTIQSEIARILTSEITEDVDDENKKNDIVVKLSKVIFQQCNLKKIYEAKPEKQESLVKDLVKNNEEIQKIIDQIKEELNPKKILDEDDADKKDILDSTIDTIYDFDKNKNFTGFKTRVLATIPDEINRVYAVTEIKKYIKDRIVQNGITLETDPKIIENNIIEVLNGLEFQKECDRIYDNAISGKIVEHITSNGNYLDFIKNIREKLGEDKASFYGISMVEFVIEHCGQQLDDARDLEGKKVQINKFMNGEGNSFRFRGEIDKIYEREGIESGSGKKNEKYIFPGITSDVFFDILAENKKYSEAIKKINGLSLETTLKISIITKINQKIIKDCNGRINSISNGDMKKTIISSYLNSPQFDAYVTGIIEENTPAPKMVAKTSDGVEIIEPDTDRTVSRTVGPDPKKAIDTRELEGTVRRFVAAADELKRRLAVVAGDGRTYVAPLLDAAERIRDINLVYNRDGNVIIGSDGASMGLGASASHGFTSSPAPADTPVASASPTSTPVSTTTVPVSPVAPAATTPDSSVTPIPAPTPTVDGSLTPAPTPVATGTPAGASDGKASTPTTPTGAKGTPATSSPADGKKAPASTDKKDTPDGKTAPSGDGKKGGATPDGKKVAPEKKEIPKVRLLEFGEKTLDTINEPKKPWYKRLAKWVVRHPIATTAICLGAGALVAAGIGAIAAGGVVPAISALNFSLPKVAAISGAVGLGAGGLIGGGLLIGSNVSKTGKKERLYKKFEKKYKKCQAIQDNIAEYSETINANKEKQKQLEEKHRKSKGILKSLGVYKRARKKVRKQNRKLTQKIREAEETYAETVSEAIDKKNELNNLESSTGKSLALGGYFDRKKKVEEDFKSGKIDKEDYTFEMEDLEEEVPGITKTSSRVKTFDGEVSELITRVKKEHATKRMSDTMDEIKRRYTILDPKVYEEPDFSDESFMEKYKTSRKKSAEMAGEKFSEDDFSTSYEEMKKKQRDKVKDYEDLRRTNPEAFKKLNDEFDAKSSTGKPTTAGKPKDEEHSK